MKLREKGFWTLESDTSKAVNVPSVVSLVARASFRRGSLTIFSSSAAILSSNLKQQFLFQKWTQSLDVFAIFRG